MALGTVVLEEALAFLVPGIAAAGLRVIVLLRDWDVEWRRAVVLGRLFIVRSALPHVEAALAWDLGVIGLDRLGVLDGDPGPGNLTARLLAEVVLRLRDRERPFVALPSVDGGEPVVVRLGG